MPIALHTGLPGAGKSLGLVERLLKLHREAPDRPVYALGIDGLQEGIAEPLDSLADWSTLPHGSIVVVDECQELMPTDRGNTPAWVQQLSTHRHYGMDFLLATQHPALISTYVRRLVGEHVHHVRKFGSTVVDRYRWPKCMDAPETATARREATKTLWTFPKECFGLYKSASSHTIKRKLPRKVYWLAFWLLLGVAAVGTAAWYVYKAGHQQQANIAAINAGGAKRALSSSSAPAAEADGLRQRDFAKWLAPRVPGIPWSAPAFDQLQVKSVPRLSCVAVEDGRCFCVTEQGTDYAVEPKMCRKMVASGVYNPFVDTDPGPIDANTSRSTAAQPALPASSLSAPVAWSSTPVNHASGIGGQEYDPPEYGTWNPDPFAAAKARQ